MAQRVNGGWIAFLAMSFAVVGMTGLFATVAAPLPLERALLRDAALDEALAAARGPDAATAMAALRPRLGESAAALDGAPEDLAARIATERAAMRTRFAAEAASVTRQLRWLVVVVTLAGALFGAVVLGSVGRRG